MATKRIIVLYDGTWCGKDTNTRSNIHILSRMVGVDFDADSTDYASPRGDVVARYFDGVGLGGDFMDYLWNGAFASQAKRECMSVYDFIVQNFTLNAEVHTQVWLFGISRGASIVRSVGGMINNCGIIRDSENTSVINQVYDIYQSPHAIYHPSSPEMRQFRMKASHQVRSPIKFMGIFDTVGARGVPRLNYRTGTGLEWPEFYDNIVSSSVEKVYHAVAMHDRFWIFEPCLASRDPKYTRNSNLAALKICQTWFPGCHYDLARQEFQFLREGGSPLESAIFPFLNIFSSTVTPNGKLADLVLLWMLRAIDAEGGGSIIWKDTKGKPGNISAAIQDVQTSIPTNENGTGDMYDNVLGYLPGGRLFSGPIAWWKNMNKSTYAILFNPVDRVIPDPGIRNGKSATVWNQVYDYTAPDEHIGGDAIETIADVKPPRYPSQTFQNYRAYMKAVHG